MKKSVLLLSLFVSTLFATAQNVHIPDANFKNKLLATTYINTNKDTAIQVAEAEAFKGILYCNNTVLKTLQELRLL